MTAHVGHGPRFRRRIRGEQGVGKVGTQNERGRRGPGERTQEEVGNEMGAREVSVCGRQGQLAIGLGGLRHFAALLLNMASFHI